MSTNVNRAIASDASYAAIDSRAADRDGITSDERAFWGAPPLENLIPIRSDPKIV